MRIIQAEQIAQAVCGMCVRANVSLKMQRSKSLFAGEPNPGFGSRPTGFFGLKTGYLPNRQTSPSAKTGMVCMSSEAGLRCISAEISMGSEGVRRGYREGLRKSVVWDSPDRVNANFCCGIACMIGEDDRLQAVMKAMQKRYLRLRRTEAEK